jgi:hypothetical protein
MVGSISNRMGVYNSVEDVLDLNSYPKHSSQPLIQQTIILALDSAFAALRQ